MYQSHSTDVIPRSRLVSSEFSCNKNGTALRAQLEMYVWGIYLLMIAISYLHLIPQLPLVNRCRLSCVLASCTVKTSSCCLRAGQYLDVAVDLLHYGLNSLFSDLIWHFYLRSPALKTKRQLVHLLLYSRSWIDGKACFVPIEDQFCFQKVSPLVSHFSLQIALVCPA